MANYTFSGTTEGFSNFTATGGYMFYNNGGTAFEYVQSDKTGVSIVVAPGDPLSFQCRVVRNPSYDYIEGGVGMVIDGLGTCTKPGYDITYTDNDSGWFAVTGTVSMAGTITTVSMRLGEVFGVPWVLEMYYDSIYIAESPPATDTARRLLKMDSDGGSLYVSGISGGTLSIFQYSLSGLTVTGTSTFGTCSYTDPDTFTRGIFPVARPGGDGILYAHGRDANNVQVQYRDYNGTLGWVDVGAGTATWATTKYCVALMPDVFRHDNLIAVFYDGAVSMTDNGTMLWDAQGSVTTTSLRTAARDANTPEVLYVAGTAAGTIYQSCNNGNTFASMGTSTMGTINAIEVLYG